MTAPRRIQLSRPGGWRKPANTIVVQGHPMTYRITIELDTTKEQAETLSHIIADWAHGEDPNALSRLPDSLEEMSPAVSLEPHHPDDDQLRQAVQHLRRLGFDTAAQAVQAARRSLHTATATDPWDDDLAARLEPGRKPGEPPGILLEAVDYHLRRLNYHDEANAVNEASTQIADDRPPVVDGPTVSRAGSGPDWEGMAATVARNAEYFRTGEARWLAMQAVTAHRARGGRVL